MVRHPEILAAVILVVAAIVEVMVAVATGEAAVMEDDLRSQHRITCGRPQASYLRRRPLQSLINPLGSNGM